MRWDVKTLQQLWLRLVRCYWFLWHTETEIEINKLLLWHPFFRKTFSDALWIFFVLNNDMSTYHHTIKKYFFFHLFKLSDLSESYHFTFSLYFKPGYLVKGWGKICHFFAKMLHVHKTFAYGTLVKFFISLYIILFTTLLSYKCYKISYILFQVFDL